MRRPPRTRRPGRIPRAEPLEIRTLLSLGAIWLGQDGSDFAGRSSAVADGLADIHVRLTGVAPGAFPNLVDIRPLGGGRWRTDGQGGGLIVARPGPTADQVDLYFDPYQTDSARPYQIDVTFGNAPAETVWITGGPVDGNLRIGSARVRADWLGQPGSDLTGPRSAVGPDGFADVQVRLTNLSAVSSVSAIKITDPAGDRWSWGPDDTAAWNAEALFAGSSATVSVGVGRNLAGESLAIQVRYDDGTTDTVFVPAGSTDPGMPSSGSSAPLPAINWGTIAATWLGQDGQGSGLGDVHVRIAGLPGDRSVAGVSLGDLAGYSWVRREGAPTNFYSDPYARPLSLSHDGGATTADLYFSPVRDESGSSLTLRLLLDDGSTWMTTVAGGFADPSLRAAAPSSTSVAVRPGDDLATIATQYGQVRLSAGTYRLSAPLVLSHAVTISADPGAVLLFHQPAGAEPWTSAVKIMAGRTTLTGFSVRFDGPIRWNSTVDYGPAVIGLRDNLDPPATSPLVGIDLRNLDLEGPPADPSGGVWQEAVDLIRMAGGESGSIVGNTLRGGSVEFLYGPWRITDNIYNGTMPGTYSFGVFVGHATHDLVLSNNRAEPIAGSGKTWRFLVLTVGGYDDTIEGNTSIGIGPRDADTIPDMNAAEIVLTESYRLAYEGSLAAVSSDGRLVRIHQPQGSSPQIGDALSVLDGPGAGQYRRIVMVLDPSTVLLDAPLPAGTVSVSIATGFVGTRFVGNTIDARGGSAACDLVLGGNLFGVSVSNNLLLGAAPFQITAAPTEMPVRWGWSQAPALGLTITDNTFQENARAGTIGVNRLTGSRMGSGRVYVSAAFRDNTFVKGAGSTLREFMTIGDDAAVDPGEVRIDQSGNRLVSGDGVGVIHVGAAWLGGVAVRSTDIPIGTPPAAPPPAPLVTLVNDTGTSGSDGITSDPTLRIAPASGTVLLEYRVQGSATYLPLPSLVFRPPGLSDGDVAVEVRAVGADGLRSAGGTIRFDLATQAPESVAGLTDDGSSVSFQPLANGLTYQYRVDGGGGFVNLGTSTSFEPPGLGPGAHRIGVRALDVAGNPGPEAWLVVDRTPPVAPGPHPLTATWLGQDGRDQIGTTSRPAPDGLSDARIRLTNLNGAVNRFELRALGAQGGRWRSNARGNAPRAFVTGDASTGTYEITFQPTRRENRRTYQVTAFMADGSTQVVRVLSGLTVRRLSLRQMRLRRIRG